MKKVAVFVDYENIAIPLRNRGIDLDWFNLANYLANEQEGRSRAEAFCYVPIDPRNEHAKDREIQTLWEDGWLVKTKVGALNNSGGYKCNMDVEMAIDMISFAIDAKPDIVVLASGDQDFAPVALKIRERGIRVEVAAFPETVSRVLLNASSGYINLEAVLENEEQDVSFKQDGQSDIETEPREQYKQFEACGDSRKIPSSGTYSGNGEDDEY